MTGVARAVLVSGNWKMHHNHFEALEVVQKLAALLRSTPLPAGREISLHPPFTSLRSVQTAVESDRVPASLGAQTCHQADRGAFTGEVSAEFLAKLGVRYVLAGHSERRAMCGESDEVVREKLDAIWRHGMVPILCVGETLEERKAGEAEAKVRSQLAVALSERPPAAVAAMVVAYEPIWAIGTGQACHAEEAHAVMETIRESLPAGDEMRVLYGGSVNPANIAEFMRKTSIDGALVGGASLAAASFAELISRSRSVLQTK